MRAQDEPKPAWAYSSETRGRRREWGFRRLPQSFSSRDAQAPARARCAGPGPGVRQVHPATHLGKEAVHCSGARTFPARLQSRKSAQRQVPGKPRVSPCASGRLQPAEPPHCHAPVAAALQHLLSASRTSSVPTAAFVSSSSKFLTSGRSAPGRRTAGGTFFPGWGRAARGWRRACLPLRSAGGARFERGVLRITGAPAATVSTPDPGAAGSRQLQGLAHRCAPPAPPTGPAPDT